MAATPPSGPRSGWPETSSGKLIARAGYRSPVGPRLLAAILLLAFLASGCTAPRGPEPDVTMGPAAFQPKVLTVAVNETVVWKNTAGLVHTVTSDNASGPLDSGNLAPGAYYEHTFTAPGNYTYHCVPHSTRQGDGTYVGMAGTIVVTVGGNDTA